MAFSRYHHDPAGGIEVENYWAFNALEKKTAEDGDTRRLSGLLGRMKVAFFLSADWRKCILHSAVNVIGFFTW